jgi:hypothetical protein
MTGLPLAAVSDSPAAAAAAGIFRGPERTRRSKVEAIVHPRVPAIPVPAR